MPGMGGYWGVGIYMVVERGRTHIRLQREREVMEGEEERRRKRRMMARSVTAQPTYHGYHLAPTGREPNTTEIHPTRKI